MIGSFLSRESLMSDFDPYLKWLGIRDPQRPPNHYRLLGLDLFESDPEVVSMAADRQMAHIRTFQIGQNGEVSQRILNELAEARRCLLDDQKRAAYDQSLREAAESADLVPPQFTQAEEHTQPPPLATSVVEADPTPRDGLQSAQLTQRPRRPFSGLAQIIGIVGGGLAAVAVSAWLIQSGWLFRITGIENPKDADRTALLDTTGSETNDNSDRGPATADSIDTDSSQTDSGLANDSDTGQKEDTLPIPVASGVTTDNVAGSPSASANITPPWEEARWPSIPDSLLTPKDDFDRLLQPTRKAIGIRDFDKARQEWLNVESESKKRHPRFDLGKRIEELRSFWDAIHAEALNLIPGDELIFRGQSVEVISKTDQGVLLAMKDKRDETRFFETNRESLDRDLAAAIANKNALYEPPVIGRYLALDFVHEKTVLTREPNAAFAGMEPTTDTPDVSSNDLSEPDSMSTTTEDVIEPTSKLAIPESAAIVEARRSVKRLFDDGYRRNSTRAIKLDAATQMLERAKTVDGKNSANKFVLLSEAASMAESVGDARTGMTALNLLNDQFEVDFWELITGLMNNVKKNLTTQRQAEDAVSVMRQLAIRAIQEKRYKEANELATTCTTVAEKVEDLSIYNDSMNLKAETKEIARMESRVRKARKDLKTNPDNPKAHEELGNFLCLVEGDYEQGLKHWVNSGKKQLVEVAELERQSAETDEVVNEVEIADAWYELGIDKKTYKDLKLMLRARHWYQQASNQSGTASSSEFDDRINELDELLKRLPSVYDPQNNQDYLRTFYRTSWRFNAGFTVRFSLAGTVRITSKGRNRTLSWEQTENNEFRVVNRSDNTTVIFRPRTSGQSVAFEKIDNQTGSIVLSGVGYPVNQGR